MFDSYRRIVGSHRPSPFQNEVTLAFSDNFYHTNAVNSTGMVYRTYTFTFVRTCAISARAASIARVLDHVICISAQPWRAPHWLAPFQISLIMGHGARERDEAKQLLYHAVSSNQIAVLNHVVREAYTCGVMPLNMITPIWHGLLLLSHQHKTL